MSFQVFDPFPKIKNAGVTTLFKDTVADCLKTKTNNERSPTPPNMEKYRKSYKQSVGTKILHYGVKDDPKPEEKIIHGVKSDYSQHVSDIFQNPQGQGIKQLVNEMHESKYASHIREPLGMPTTERKYQFPAQVQNQDFQFGVATQFNDTAKDLLYPAYNPIHENEQTKAQYLKSHQTYEAGIVLLIIQNKGEQKKRNYNWPVDPNDFQFGKKEIAAANETMNALHPDNTNDKFPQTVVVKKNLEDFKDFKEDQLGKPRNLGQKTQHLPPDHVYGYKFSANEWNAAKCLRGEATDAEVKDDNSLGKATKFGFMNQTKSGDEQRLFGAPTIRTDIIKPKLKSVADPQNYGDEPRAIELLFPEQYSHLGLDQIDFIKRRSKDEIRDIFESIGLSYKIGKFEAIFNRAKEIQKQSDNGVCVKAFLMAVAELHNID